MLRTESVQDVVGGAIGLVVVMGLCRVLFWAVVIFPEIAISLAVLMTMLGTFCLCSIYFGKIDIPHIERRAEERRRALGYGK